MSDHIDPDLPSAADVNSTLDLLPESSTASSYASPAPSIIGNDDTAHKEDSIAPFKSEVGVSLIAPFVNDEWPLTFSEYLEYRPNIWYHDEDEPSLEAISAPESELPGASSVEVTGAALELSATFTVFPNLPLELRRQIWKAAIVPRLVHWRPGGGKPPGIIHACNESRAETFMNVTDHSHLTKAYMLIELKYRRNDTYSLFINYELDILYRKREFPSLVHERVFRRKLCRGWSQPVKRFAINLDQAEIGSRIYAPRAGGPFRPPWLWIDLNF